MINGVKVKKLNVIKDERGRLMEILRNDDDIFEYFGQVYMTTAVPGAVKAWHYHKQQTDNFTCIRGKMLLGLYDGREGSYSYGETMRFEISLDDPVVVQIPEQVFHGFKCLGDEEAVVINVVTKPYNKENPDEFRIDAMNNNIPFDWGEDVKVWG
jgi:dTDP-4-dehydrorhamnose 3,5-epimerase